MLVYLIVFFFKQKRSFALILILFLTYFIPINLKAGKDGFKINTVVIDPGHGGKDPGTSGKHVKEKDIVLKIALKLGGYIEKNLPDVKVIYTRKTDVFIPLNKRAEIANKNNADLFISIHANYFGNSKIHGTETYVMGLSKSKENLEVAKTENSAIFYEDNYEETYKGFDPNSPETYIAHTILQNNFLDQSINFAGFVQKEFKEKAKRNDRGVRQNIFIVLVKTAMPSVLIETGYVSNAKEERYLMSDEGQTYLASAIYRAFRDYKKWYEEQNEFEDIEVTTEHNINQEKQPPEIKKTNISDQGIVFKIQISSSTKPVPLNSDFFQGLTDVEEIPYKGFYKYTIGNSKSFKEIVSEKNHIKEKFPDAFIISLKNGEIIPINQALKEIN